jgi:hypothetical protein
VVGVVVLICAGIALHLKARNDKLKKILEEEDNVAEKVVTKVAAHRGQVEMHGLSKGITI